MPLSLETLLADPTRTPDCRGRRIEALLESAAKPNRFDEPIVLEAVRVLRPSVNKRKHQSKTYPWFNAATLLTAKQIHADDKPLRWAIEAFLMTDLSVSQIAAKVGVPTCVAEAFGTLWCEVRDRTGQVKSFDWLLPQVIRGNWNPSHPPEAVIWKYAAVSGGPIIVSILIADHLGLPEPAVPNRALLAAKVRLLAKMFFTPLSDQVASAQVVAECERLIPANPLDDSKKGRMRRLHIDCLKMAAGVPCDGDNKLRETSAPKTPPIHSIQEIIAEAQHASTL